jgi:hypothetical protein
MTTGIHIIPTNSTDHRDPRCLRQDQRGGRFADLVGVGAKSDWLTPKSILEIFKQAFEYCRIVGS